jgi:ribosomal 50S subunit-associated protein YjgA (DUF615 family)
MAAMQGHALDQRQLALIARLRRVTDPSVLDALEHLLDEHQQRSELMPLEDAQVDAILRDLLAPETSGDPS